MRSREVCSTWLFPLAGIVLIAGCDGSDGFNAPPFEPAPAKLMSAEARPFAFTLTGTANPDFSQGPCNVSNVESGVGIALHLGEVTWASNEVVSFCVDPADSELGEVTGDFVITAANGDQVSGTYVTVVRADFIAGTLMANGDFMITGGTGRFAGASGSGAVSVTGSLGPPFDVAGTFTGTIVY